MQSEDLYVVFLHLERSEHHLTFISLVAFKLLIWNAKDFGHIIWSLSPFSSFDFEFLVNSY